MKKNIIILLVIILVAFLASTVFWFSRKNAENYDINTLEQTSVNKTKKDKNNYINPPKKFASKMCFWEAGQCEALIKDGFYFNKISGECKYWPTKQNGCTNPPFSSIKECNEACIINNAECHIDDIKNSKKFSSLIMMHVAQKNSTDEMNLFLYFDHKLSDVEINNIEQRGITIKENTWIPPVGNHPYGFYAAVSKINDICELINLNIVKRVESAEETHKPQ